MERKETKEIHILPRRFLSVLICERPQWLHRCVYSGYTHGLGGRLPGSEPGSAAWNHVALDKLHNSVLSSGNRDSISTYLLGVFCLFFNED